MIKKKLFVFIFIFILLAGSISAFSIFGIKINLFNKKPTIVCAEYSDNLLFSSGYTRNINGNIEYQSWIPELKCSDLGKDNCFIKDIETESRYLYLNPINKLITNEEGYVSISEASNNCENPKNLSYNNYIFDKSWNKQDKLNYLLNKEYNYSSCYGIKSYTSQYSITDTFKINYKLCWKEK